MPVTEKNAAPTPAQAAKDDAAGRVAAHRARQDEVRQLVHDALTAGDPGAREEARGTLARYVAGDFVTNADDPDDDPIATIAAAVDVLAEAEVLREAAKRNAEQLALEAERDYDRLRSVLWPAIEGAATEQRPDLPTRRDGSPGKTLKLLPWTSRQLQWRMDRNERFEVEDEREALEDLEKRLGFGEPERLGLVKVKPRLSRSKLREWCGLDPETGAFDHEPPRGVEVEPKQERLRPWRW